MKIWEDQVIDKEGETVVVIGPNGSGKTQYGIKLAKLNDADHIGALRNIALQEHLPMMSYLRAEIEVKNHLTRKKKNYWELSNEMDTLFSKLMADDASSASKYRNKIAAGEKAVIVTTKIMQLSQLWEELFPSRRLHFDDYTPKVHSEYMSADYAARLMSDGERVALYLAARVLDSNSETVIIDEPEVHFHSKLAVSFWDALEKMRPNKKFVYITHNLEFALSRNKPIFLVVKPNTIPLVIEKASQIPTETSIDLLAAASLSIFAKRVVFCEGIADRSKDNMLLSAWFNSKDTAIVPLSSCKNVIEAVLSYKKTDIIQNLEVLGIIDQDYSSVGAIEAIKDDVFVLPFHEIESLLLHEDIVAAVLLDIGKERNEINQIITDLKAKAKELYPKELLSKTVSERYKNEIEFALKYQIRGLKSSTDNEVQKRSHLEVLAKTLPEAEKIYDNAEKQVTDAIGKGYLEILKILPGKPLLTLLLKALGMTDDTYMTLLCKLIKEENPATIECLMKYLPKRAIT